MLNIFEKNFEKIINLVIIVSEVLVCVLIFAGAVIRYIFHKDFFGSEELILLASFWLYFFGSILAAKHNTHIKAEMLDMFVKNIKIRIIIDIIKYIINILVCISASYLSVVYLIWNINVNMKSNVFRFPMFMSVLPIAISFVAWSFYCIKDLIVYLKKIL